MKGCSPVDRATAMHISSRKATLHRLPRPGVRWRWGEVVAGHTASSDEERIDQERAAMRRHQEARERLQDLGWTMPTSGRWRTQ